MHRVHAKIICVHTPIYVITITLARDYKSVEWREFLVKTACGVEWCGYVKAAMNIELSNTLPSGVLAKLSDNGIKSGKVHITIDSVYDITAVLHKYRIYHR